MKLDILAAGAGQVVLLIGSPLPPKSDVRVEQTSQHADVDPNTVEPREDVVASNEHAQICYADVFQASHNGGGQRRVELRAQDGAVR